MTGARPLVTVARMHDDELTITEDQVRALLADQLPEWADLDVLALPHRGTDHATFRLGAELAVRMPRIEWARECVEREWEWPRRIAPLLDWEAPTPLALGEPGRGYPWRWSVCRWVAGAPPTTPDVELAADVARMIHDLRALDPAGGRAARRAHPLGDLHDLVAANTAAVADEFDPRGLEAAWEESRDAEPWDGVGVWLHGDIAPGNLIVRDGRLTGVIDWGGLGVGDPSGDLGIAWNFFGAGERTAFRVAVGDDDTTWLRGRGWALNQALLQLPYYRTRYTPLAEHARHTIREVLIDAGGA